MDEQKKIHLSPISNIENQSVLVGQKSVSEEFRKFLKDTGSDHIVISLDKRGRLVHSNALHMILIWRGQLCEETTLSRNLIPLLENELRERTLGVDRVIDNIDTQIQDFASEDDERINNWVEDIRNKMKNSFRSYNYTSEREEAYGIRNLGALNWWHLTSSTYLTSGLMMKSTFSYVEAIAINKFKNLC